MNRLNRLKVITALITIASIGIIAVMFFVFKKADMLIPAVIVFLFAAVLVAVFYSLDSILDENAQAVEENIAAGNRSVFLAGDVGVLSLSEDFQITWMSSMFHERHLNHTGEKILLWLPELQDLLMGNSERSIVIINDDKYAVSRSEEEGLLFFKDISKEYDLEKKLEDDASVFGIVSYDNYDESSESEDDISYVNTNIKVPVIEYFKKFNVVYKTLRNNRLLLILNEKQFRDLSNDRFSILNDVRREAKKNDLDITLSMAFARGSDDLGELDAAAQTLIELAQTRGGDQVVVRKMGEEAVYFGGSSEAREKRSRVKARVMTNTIRDLITDSENVIIVGHTDMDADCIGSALVMSNIARILNREAFIVCRSGGADAMIADVLEKYSDELEKKHNLVTENEAINHLSDDSLVIMVDHHSLAQSNGVSLLKQAKKIAIIDHHRRRADLDVDPTLIYVEAGASSATELTVEFLQYIGKHPEIYPNEANIMYLGLLIDTNRFRVRTGTRTFDVAKTLRNYGADPVVCDELSQEPYELVQKRTALISSAVLYHDEVLISTMKNDIVPRSIASQAADSMIQVKEIEASFVIAHASEDDVIISARSKGKINVQVILEKLGGGGHMTSAGYQSRDESVSDLKFKLQEVLDEYYEEGGMENESDPA
ncbi:MAG: DHH family phosphoesterase [Erysipelotrichaceae bacterium]|nr:DHH family phosphoesterase [Erysipelotrichaceae bacterium]